MNSVIKGIMVVFLSVLSCGMEGKTIITLKPNVNLQDLLVKKNAIYFVNDEIDLNGKLITLPEYSTLKFGTNGCLKNGIIMGNHTLFKGHVRLHCKLKGSFNNKEIPVSWLHVTDSIYLSDQIASIFNLETPCTVNVNQDIHMDGSKKDVSIVRLSGKARIRNCCAYRVRGDVYLEDINFSGFESYKELFIDLRDIEKPVNVKICNITFDGCWNISRFLYCPYKQNGGISYINITGSTITRVTNYVVQFQVACTGTVSNNTIFNIGSDELSNVIGFHLGDSDKALTNLNAYNFNITNNVFKDFRIPYSNTHNSREAHAMLIYGNNNIIRRNKVVNFFSTESGNSNTGLDCEGIYLKGGGNKIENNYLENCVGASPDGAITIKMTACIGNIVKNNVIKHNYGIGIQCYTPESVIENNEIFSTGEAETSIAMFQNKNTCLINNRIVSNNDSGYHAGVVLRECENIFVNNNDFVNTSGVLVTYQCLGKIQFENNSILIKNKTYGMNTYFTAPFYFRSVASHIFKGNVIFIEGSRGSQVIEAPISFNGEVVLDENTVKIEDTEAITSAFTYFVRNVEKLSVVKNRDKSRQARISKISNLHNTSQKVNE